MRNVLPSSLATGVVLDGGFPVEVFPVKVTLLRATPEQYRLLGEAGITPVAGRALEEAFLEEVEAGVYVPERGYPPCFCKAVDRLVVAWKGDLWHEDFVLMYLDAAVRWQEIHSEVLIEHFGLHLPFWLTYVCWKKREGLPWLKGVFGPC